MYRHLEQKKSSQEDVYSSTCGTQLIEVMEGTEINGLAEKHRNFSTELDVFQPLGLTKNSNRKNFLSYARGVKENYGIVLEVFGHGSPGAFNLGGSNLNAEQLHYKLNEIVTDYNKYSKVKLIVCHSADDVNGSSLAASFSNVSKKITVGFKGEVFKRNASPILGRILDYDMVNRIEEGFDLFFIKTIIKEKIQSIDKNTTIEGSVVIFNPKAN